jgi:hypothetical protein
MGREGGPGHGSGEKPFAINDRTFLIFHVLGLFGAITLARKLRENQFLASAEASRTLLTFKYHACRRNEPLSVHVAIELANRYVTTTDAHRFPSSSWVSM